MPYCKCGKLFRDGADAYCVKCGFETRASATASGAAPNAGHNLISDAALQSPGESAALLAGLALFAGS